MAAPHNVKRLQQRHARLHHGGQLTREKCNVFGFDGLARTKPLFFDFDGYQTLASQMGLYLVFSGGADFATSGLALAVFAFPLVYKGLSRRDGTAIARGFTHWSQPPLLPRTSNPV